MLIILHLTKGHSRTDVAAYARVARSTVYRVAERFRALGLAGLADRREDNHSPGVDPTFLLILRQVVADTPRDYGWARAICPGGRAKARPRSPATPISA